VASNSVPTSDVVVVGAGVIGTAVAWRCAQRGLTVSVVDPDPERGAWHTAAGMLAPLTELHYTETPLLRLNRESLRRYAAFAREVSDEAGQATGYAETGTLQVAWDAADLAALRDLHAFAAGLGTPMELVGGRELRRLEPALAPGLPGGLLAAGDHQVDPRLLHAALLTAAERRGVRFVASTASVVIDGDRVRGVRLADRRQLASPHVVLAAGAWSASVAGLPADAVPPVRPVKGQTLRLRLRDGAGPGRVIRASVKGSPVYAVPRGDGRLVVGASSEEARFDDEPRAGAVYELLRDAQTVLPELGEAVFEEVCTGFRPGTPDNAPLLGPTAVDGLVAATGHYRNGILLTPVTADGIADLLADGALPDVLAPFVPTRFAEVS
jgi:glycine oxidase